MPDALRALFIGGASGSLYYYQEKGGHWLVAAVFLALMALAPWSDE